jgi:aspartokinase
MLNQGISEINVILGVDSPDFEPAIRAIYDAFTESN